MTLTVGIYLFADVEVLDFAGPYEVFTTASRVALRRAPDRDAPFRAITVAASREPVRARAGLLAIPDHTLADHPPLDLLIIPGGVVDAELERPEVIRWIAAGIDMSLHLVARLADRELAIATARQMDVPWQPDTGVTA